MTSTTTPAQTTQDHDHPCYCDICMPATVECLLDERAVLLRAALLDRLYTEGQEQDLADELIAAIPAASRASVLEWMLEQDHLSPRVVAVDCLLDECDIRSYQAVSEMARILLDAIYAQNTAPDALRILVVNEICKQARLSM